MSVTSLSPFSLLLHPHSSPCRHPPMRACRPAPPPSTLSAHPSDLEELMRVFLTCLLTRPFPTTVVSLPCPSAHRGSEDHISVLQVLVSRLSLRVTCPWRLYLSWILHPPGGHPLCMPHLLLHGAGQQCQQAQGSDAHWAGRPEDLCGSRTGGWSLPGVMSDWQRCVDWFLAKYCRCRLRFDWCWCSWRTSVKGCCRWGLQVWRRQVGYVRGTWWPIESSAGRMVARTARWSRGRFLGWASKPRWSRDNVGADSWVVIGGGYTEFVGFAAVHQKTTRLLGWATKPRPKTRRGGAATQAGSTAQEGRSGHPGRSRREASQRRTRAGIARLASRLSKVAVDGHPSDGENLKTSKFALEGHVSLVIY
jgi:hypothetical protein